VDVTCFYAVKSGRPDAGYVHALKKLIFSANGCPGHYHDWSRPRI
jgi:hypothetical protein